MKPTLVESHIHLSFSYSQKMNQLVSDDMAFVVKGILKIIPVYRNSLVHFVTDEKHFSNKIKNYSTEEKILII